MRTMLLLLISGVVATSTVAPPAEAQFTKRVAQRVKQAAAERKRQTEENAVNRAAEPADSAIARVSEPVESLTARVGGKAGSAVGRLGRDKDSSTEEETRIRRELAAGKADLPGVAFEPGSDAITPSSEPSLRALLRGLRPISASEPQARGDQVLVGEQWDSGRAGLRNGRGRGDPGHGFGDRGSHVLTRLRNYGRE